MLMHKLTSQQLCEVQKWSGVLPNMPNHSKSDDEHNWNVKYVDRIGKKVHVIWLKNYVQQKAGWIHVWLDI